MLACRDDSFQPEDPSNEASLGLQETFCTDMDSVENTERFFLFSNTPSIDWCVLFGNDRPIEVEVGSGKGAFLLGAARERPDRNFVGIEIQERWVRLTCERLIRRDVRNVQILHADASIIVENFIPDASVSTYHIYFPDPWWKRRHRRRILIRPAVARAIRRTLTADGHLSLATDVEERFRSIVAVLRDAELFEIEDAATQRPCTNFESKYHADGRPIYRATFARADHRGARLRPDDTH